MAKRKLAKRQGAPALNVRPIDEEVKRRLDVGRARQGLRTFAGYLERLERLHAVVDREARKAGSSAGLARGWLSEAGLRFDSENS